VNGEAGVLAGVASAVGQNGVVAGAAGAAEEEVAALEDGDGVAEDEVDRAVNVAFCVELAEGVGVEGVLVPCYAAPVEDGTVGGQVQGHRLLALWAGVVLESDVSCDEAIAGDRCEWWQRWCYSVLSGQQHYLEDS